MPALPGAKAGPGTRHLDDARPGLRKGVASVGCGRSVIGGCCTGTAPGGVIEPEQDRE